MQCPSGHGVMVRGQKAWVCEECLHRVSLQPGDHHAPSNVTPPPPEALAHLPSLLAIPLSEYHRELHPVMRLHRLCDAVEILTRFCTMVALGEARRPHGGALPPSLLRHLQDRIERPTFGQWRAMLDTLEKSLARGPGRVVPEMGTFVSGWLLPALPGGDAPERCLVSLRNLLAHGGAMSCAASEHHHDLWWPRLERLTSALAFLREVQVCHVTGGFAWRLVGPRIELGEPMAPGDLPEELRDGLTQAEGHVVLLRGNSHLDLWPLCGYGRASSATAEGVREARADSPLVYFRAEPDRLLYAALGAEMPQGERRDALAAFRSLFRLEAREGGVSHAGATTDFEEEIRRDAESLVGRQVDIALAKEAVKRTDSGVLWIGGPGGIGKSFIMARLAADLRGDPRTLCRIAWRFKGGDQARCNRTAFLRHAVERLAAWEPLGRHDLVPALGDAGLREQLVEFLSKVGHLEAPASHRRPPRVLFILDGMDEIERLDPTFAQVPFEIAYPNVAWLCAGRPEGSLSRVFSSDRCTHIFEGGMLPQMKDNDIRGMLIEGTGSQKYELLRRDQEGVDSTGRPTMANAAVEAVVKRADGLPLFVHFVLQDILAGHFGFQNLESRLPAGLNAYYDDLLRRLSIGELQALLTPLVVTLAWARGPLDAETLHLLMVRRKVLLPGAEGEVKLWRALEALKSLVRPASVEGGRWGLEPYHPTFREHILEDPGRLIGDQNALARDEFHALVTGWAELPREHPARMYALRFGPRHLTGTDQWDDVERLLTDLRFVEAKCAAGMTYDLAADYVAALATLPEGRAEAEEREGPVRRYTEAMIAYARRWSEARDRHAGDPQRYPLPTPEEIPLPEVLPSVRLWTDEEIRRDNEEALSLRTRLGRIRTFAQFVASEGHSLMRHAHRPGFCLQQAHNSAARGPVAEAAKHLLSNNTGQYTLLLHEAWRPPLDLHPTCIRLLDDNANSVRAVAITANGRRAVSGSDIGTIRLWDLETGKCVRQMEGDMSPAKALAITPDGRIAVSGDSDGLLHEWDLETGTCLKDLRGHAEAVNAVALTPDGRLALSGSSDKTLRLWDLKTGTCFHVLGGHTKGISDVDITPDGRRGISGSSDETVRYWDLENGICLHILRGHEVAVLSVALTSDGHMGLSGGHLNFFPKRDATALMLWDLEKGASIGRLTTENTSVQAVGITSDGRRALSAHERSGIRLWDLETGTCLRVLDSHGVQVYASAMTPEGRRAVSGGHGGVLEEWDLEKVGKPELADEHSHRAITVTQDGGSCRILAGSEGGPLRLLDAETGACLKVLRGHAGYVWGVAVTDDKRSCVSGGKDNTLRLWDLETGKCIRLVKGHGSAIFSVALTPDGRRVVTEDDSYALRIWDPETGTCVGVLEGHNDEVSEVMITPCGRWVLSTSMDRTLRLWDLEECTCVRVIGRNDNWELESALTPDGRTVISSDYDEDNVLQVWDLKSGNRTQVLRGHDGYVSAVAVTPDGRCIVSVSCDTTLRVWDLQSGTCIRVVEGTSHGAGTMVVSNNGRHAIAAAFDGTLCLWDLESGKQTALASSLIDCRWRLQIAGQWIVGTMNGRLQCIRLPGAKDSAPPFVSPTRLWRFGPPGTPGHWDDNLTTVCTHCGKRFPVSHAMLGTEIRCASGACGKPLRLNTLA